MRWWLSIYLNPVSYTHLDVYKRQVLDILDKAEIASYFTEVVTSENGFARKPSPDSFLYLINKYDIKHGLVIGDRQIDIAVSYTHLEVYKRQNRIGAAYFLKQK